MFSVFTVSLGSGSRARLTSTRVPLETVWPANRSRPGSPLGTWSGQTLYGGVILMIDYLKDIRRLIDPLN